MSDLQIAIRVDGHLAKLFFAIAGVDPLLRDVEIAAEVSGRDLQVCECIVLVFAAGEKHRRIVFFEP